MFLYIDNLVSASGQSLYALKVLKAHGLKGIELSGVCRATMISKLSYASPAWWGYTTAMDHARLQATVNKAKRWGIYDRDAPDLEAIINRSDQMLFKNVLNDSTHVLHALLPPVKQHKHDLRPKAHNRSLPTKTPVSKCNFLTRMLYRNIY